MLTRPVVRWLVFGFCLIALLAWMFMITFAGPAPSTEPVVCRDKGGKL